MLRSLDGSEKVVNSKPVRSADYSVEIQHSGPAALPAIYHNLHLVTVMLSGESAIVRGKAGSCHAARLAAGESSVYPAGPGRQVTWPDGVHCLYVHLHPRLVRRKAASALPEVTLETRPRLRDHVIREIGFELHQLVHSDVPIDRGAAHDLVMALAHHVSAAYAAPAQASLRVGSRPLEEVLDVFRERTASSSGVSTLATWCDLSRSRFSRRIRTLTGLWPQAMIMGSRIEAAKHFLEQGERSLSEVAYACGFADQSHLTRTLGRATGLTPAPTG